MRRIAATPAQIREYVGRDWAAFERSSRAYWQALLAREGPSALLRATDGARRYVEAVDPTWPTRESRADDLDHLVRFKRRIDAAAHAFTRRNRPR